ncbi:MAG TPA: HPr family phosphocarrier protein [Spirochaetota bacterium]|nr:HPr family phosphocarrier protein [Spirochaetota bacterium]
MVTRDIIITKQEGIHLIPATAIAQKALAFPDNTIRLAKDGLKVNAQSVTDIIRLNAGFQSTVSLSIAGPDEEKCLQDMLTVFKETDLADVES